jgi:hypothetical protein
MRIACRDRPGGCIRGLPQGQGVEVLRYPPKRTSYARPQTLETLIKVLAVCRVIMYLGPEQGHIRDTRSNQGGFA